MGRMAVFAFVGPEPWSTNRGASWQRNMRLHREWADAAGWAWKAMPYRVRKDMIGVPCRVKVTIPFPQRRRRDPSNYIGTVVKAVVDGLVLVGVWPDDTPDWVEIVEPVLRIGGQLTEVLLEER